MLALKLNHVCERDPAENYWRSVMQYSDVYNDIVCERKLNIIEDTTEDLVSQSSEDEQCYGNGF